MNKRLLTIIVISIATLMIIVFGILIIINKASEQTGTSTLQNNSYYVEPGMEKLAKIAKPAIESYLNQSISEATTSRNERLGKLFSTDSPVYKRELDLQNFGPDTVKSTAEVTSVVSSDAEGEDPMVVVYVNLTHSTKNDSTEQTQTYWVVLTKTDDGSYKAYDVGAWVE